MFFLITTFKYLVVSNDTQLCSYLLCLKCTVLLVYLLLPLQELHDKRYKTLILLQLM